MYRSCYLGLSRERVEIRILADYSNPEECPVLGVLELSFTLFYFITVVVL